MPSIEKTWGWELEIVNTPEYCGKELFVRKDCWSSEGKYHYHKIKDETFYIIDGTLTLHYETEEGVLLGKKLRVGQSFRIKPGMKHRFTTKDFKGCKFIEFSTTHKDSDSYRVERNSYEGTWVE